MLRSHRHHSSVPANSPQRHCKSFMLSIIITGIVAFMLLLGTAANAQANVPQPQAAQLAAAPASPDWVRYTDNAEGAFSMDIPVGYQVEGGLYRFGYFDVRWMMDIRSLDGKVIIRIDDANIPPYVKPGPRTGRAGQPMARPHLYQMVVDNYQQARPYARAYAKRRFTPVCTALTPTRSDWAPTMPKDWRFKSGVRFSQASVEFSCDSSDGPRIATVFARTSIQGDHGLWIVDPIISILASPDRLQDARTMTQKMIDSWEITAKWKDYQEEMTRMGIQEIRGGFTRFMQQMAVFHQQSAEVMNQQVAQFENQSKNMPDQGTGWGDILTGVTNPADPATGNTFQNFTGPQANHFINGAGIRINSNIDPGNGFHPMGNVGP